MRLRGSGKKSQKIEPQMAPMIDIVFLLLVFFLLTLQIRAQEGDFQLNMPLNGCGWESDQPIRVRLLANDDGSLANIIYRNEQLGLGERAFEKLNQRVRTAVGYRAGYEPLSKDLEIVIQANYNLNYQFTIKALNACSCTLEASAAGVDQRVLLSENVSLAPPTNRTK